MPDPDLITSTANRRVVEARKLRQRKYRRETGLFLLEGIQALHMALDAGVTPAEVFYTAAYMSTRGAKALLDDLRTTRATLLPVAPPVMEALSERDEPQGIVAVLPIMNPALGEVTLPRPALVLVLDRLQDPGNLGTLIRTADAVGASAVVLLEPTADPYDPKAVRASMGSLFNLPVITAGEPEEVFAWLNYRGCRVVAADANAGTPWGSDAEWQGRVALVLGNEARGLSADVIPFVGHNVHLPVRGKADSLNVATAGGILMYFWARANLPFDGNPL